MTRHRSPESQARYKAYQRAYNHEHLRKRTPEEDYMANLLDMGTPSSIMELVDSVHLCDIGSHRKRADYMLCYPHWKPIMLCRAHEQMRRAKIKKKGETS